ncbi:hypothetical protein N7510_006391 [Penicillium lagena]|uniref:uncharacterized protein n=1 Tax=Penicillium lagena TaxID=94218 RepID=UPI0025413BE2|nr:uncharacterized protein N7510_006391 [Penicillium lagena]KAJ5613197.1 hypothetical protein N7510_006391 [Penicillium lagena]
MRFTHLIPTSLLLFSSVLAATVGPLPRDSKTSLKPLDTRVAELQRRDDGCETIASEIETIGTSKSIVIYGSFGGSTAYYVCQLKNGAECKTLALVVASGIMTILSALHQTGAINLSTREEEKHTMSMFDFFHKHLGDNGIEYKAITDSTEELLRLYGKDQRKPLSVTSLHGVKHLNNTPVNMDIYDFGNGEGHVHLPHDMLEDRSETSIHSRLGKRLSSAPGFKLSYTARLPTELSKAHQADMATSLANWWANTADETDLHDMIGFIETGHTANVYYRLIPETVDFGLNYETVNSCGQMSQYL